MRPQQTPPVSSTPSSRDYMRQDPIQYPDPDIIALDNRFRRYIVGNTTIRRQHFGTLWAEGPAWNGVGRYLVWSDIPNNVQMRWIEDDSRVTTKDASFRANTADVESYVTSPTEL
jgi:gluconolactonase